MALDKVILDHVEEMDKIEDDIGNKIDSLINNIDIDAVIDDPEGALTGFGSAIILLLEDQYYPEVADMGIEFAKEVRKDGDIQISKSKDPKLNEDLVDTDGEI